MAVTKYVITNNLSAREEAEAARGAFKSLYTVAPFIVK